MIIKESSILDHGDKPRGILKDDSLETLSGIHPLPQGERFSAQVVIKRGIHLYCNPEQTQWYEWISCVKAICV
ncbi:MAG: hypothetical protein COA82_07685 [Alkaliphilus sp.]|nr:MAG: hypothetical protein COA82_07685 [Alkaliphilus sp.]